MTFSTLTLNLLIADKRSLVEALSLIYDAINTHTHTHTHTHTRTQPHTHTHTHTHACDAHHTPHHMHLEYKFKNWQRGHQARVCTSSI